MTGEDEERVVGGEFFARIIEMAGNEVEVELELGKRVQYCRPSAILQPVALVVQVGVERNTKQ
eukprot:scaffold4653_cov53-Cyclotella_meneghiniana.AAC.2